MGLGKRHIGFAAKKSQTRYTHSVVLCFTLINTHTHNRVLSDELFEMRATIKYETFISWCPYKKHCVSLYMSCHVQCLSKSGHKHSIPTEQDHNRINIYGRYCGSILNFKVQNFYKLHKKLTTKSCTALFLCPYALQEYA